MLGQGYDTTAWLAQAAAMGYDQASCLAMMANAAAYGTDYFLNEEIIFVKFYDSTLSNIE